ncbi:AMP-binding protein [Phocaeicola sp.]
MFGKEILQPVVANLERFSERNAFCIENKFYTYHDFSDMIKGIRILLKSREIKNKNVGLVTNNDIETYASIFALWIEGYSYVPLHINQPIDRCCNIIEQVGIDTILDSSKKSRYGKSAIICTNEIKNTNTNINIDQNATDDDLAYILFTSGSTGVPKGVTISRGNIAAFINSFWDTGIQIDEKDKCLQCFDLTFDVSVQCYLSALIKGACIFTVPYTEGKYLYVAGLMEEYRLSFAVMAPSMLRYMQPFFEQMDMTELRTCILTAEACPKKLLEQVYRYNPDIKLFDFYGPTETTIYCTYYKLSNSFHNKELNGIISIGKMLKNVSGIILREDGIECECNEKGELCVAGLQVTPGYWNNSEKNISSFFERELGGNLMRFYRTGDLCYRDEDGDIMYSGRIDNQVKIQGYRIELGEIEHQVREFLPNKNVICLTKEVADIATLFLIIEGEEFATKELIDYLGSKLPSYMIPSRILFVKIFPLNSSDKVDRKKIKLIIA